MAMYSGYHQDCMYPMGCSDEKLGLNLRISTSWVLLMK